MDKVIVTREGDFVGEYELNKDVMTVGRAQESDVALKSQFVSRTHAKIERKGTGYTVTDLGSRNGITVNGTKTMTAELKNGDEVALENFVLRFEIETVSGATQIISTAGAGGATEMIEVPEEKKTRMFQFGDEDRKGAGEAPPVEGPSAKIIMTRGGETVEVPITRDVMTIGSDPANDIVIEGDEFVSRKHTQIERKPSGYVAVNLSKTNGTMIDGHLISEQTLDYDCEIQIGNTKLAVVVGRAKPVTADVGSVGRKRKWLLPACAAGGLLVLIIILLKLAESPDIKRAQKLRGQAMKQEAAGELAEAEAGYLEAYESLGHGKLKSEIAERLGGVVALEVDSMIKKGKLEDAASKCKAYIQKLPVTSTSGAELKKALGDVLYNLGKRLHANGESDGARSKWEEVISTVGPEDENHAKSALGLAEIYYNEGVTLYAAGEVRNAVSNWKHVEELGAAGDEYYKKAQAAILYHGAVDKNEMGEVYDAKQMLKKYFETKLAPGALEKTEYYQSAKDLQQQLEK